MLLREDVLNILKNHKSQITNHKSDEMLRDIKIGLAGSYASNHESDESDIDIVFDGDSMRVEAMEYIRGLFPVNVDVLWLDLIEKEDKELDNFMLSLNLPINEFSLYKTIKDEVIWV